MNFGNILYSYMKDFVLLYRLDTKEHQDFQLFVHSVQQATTRQQKAMFKIGDRIRILQYNLHFRKRYELQFIQKVQEMLLFFSENSQQTELKLNKFF